MTTDQPDPYGLGLQIGCIKAKLDQIFQQQSEHKIEQQKNHLENLERFSKQDKRLGDVEIQVKAASQSFDSLSSQVKIMVKPVNDLVCSKKRRAAKIASLASFGAVVWALGSAPWSAFCQYIANHLFDGHK